MRAARERMDLGSRLRSIAAWALLCVIMLFVVLALLVLRIARPAVRARASRILVERAASLYLRSSPLYRISVSGRDRLPRSGAYVLVANHESGLDGACLMLLEPRARFLAASWLFRAPVIGFVMRSCAHIPVGRRTAPGGPVEAACEALSAGTNVAVFPEGEYGEGEVGVLRRGAFVAARQAGVPIVPVRLRGSGAAWRPGTLLVQGRNDVRIEVLEPMSAETVRSFEQEALVAHVRDVLAEAGEEGGGRRDDAPA